MSKCRNYALDTSALVATGLPSNKELRYAEANIGVVDEIMHLLFDAREKEIHMTLGLENHLISTNRFVEEDYVQVFDKEQVNIHDVNNVEIKNNQRSSAARMVCAKGKNVTHSVSKGLQPKFQPEHRHSGDKQSAATNPAENATTHARRST